MYLLTLPMRTYIRGRSHIEAKRINSGHNYGLLTTRSRDIDELLT